MVNRTDEAPSRTALEERSKALFDESVGNVDGRARSALTQARYAALAELERQKRPLLWRMWGPLTGIAAAAFVLLALFAPLRLTPTPGEGATPFEDLEIVADSEDLEMLQELEFYVWMDSAGALPNDG